MSLETQTRMWRLEHEKKGRHDENEQRATHRADDTERNLDAWHEDTTQKNQRLARKRHERVFFRCRVAAGRLSAVVLHAQVHAEQTGTKGPHGDGRRQQERCAHTRSPNE